MKIVRFVLESCTFRFCDYKAPLDVAIGAHTHRYEVTPEGKAGNPCPNIVGGGPSMKRSTLMVLSKRGKNMTLRVLNAEGEEVDKLDL